jgi:hypothetical protein
MGLDYTNIIKVNKDDTSDLIDYLENRYRFYFLSKDCVGLSKLSSKLGKDFTMNEIGALIDLSDEEDILYCESVNSFPKDVYNKFDCILVVSDGSSNYSVYSREGYINPKQRSLDEDIEDYILDLLGVE